MGFIFNSSPFAGGDEYNGYLRLNVPQISGGGGGVPNTGLTPYIDLSAAPSSGTTWVDTGTAGINATINGTFSVTTDSYGTGITTSVAGASYISHSASFFSSFNNIFSIQLLASFNPSVFQASPWGVENLGAKGGYYAYFGSLTSLVTATPVPSSRSVTVSNIGTTALWTWTFNSGTYALYKNNTQLNTNTLSIPTGSLPSTVNWGARHANVGGGGYSLPCPGTYRRMMIYNYPLTQAQVTSGYNNIKSYYGI